MGRFHEKKLAGASRQEKKEARTRTTDEDER
jgi:hypothetical protein